MKKLITGIITVAVLTAGMTVSAFAGTWATGTKGWWYDNGNGTYAKDG